MPTGSAHLRGCTGLLFASGRPERAPPHCGYSMLLFTEGNIKGFFRLVFNTARPSFWKIEYC